MLADLKALLSKSSTGRTVLEEIDRHTTTAAEESRVAVVREVEALEAQLAKEELEFERSQKAAQEKAAAAHAAWVTVAAESEKLSIEGRGRVASLRASVAAKRAALQQTAIPEIAAFLHSSEQGIETLRSGGTWQGLSYDGMSGAEQERLVDDIRTAREEVAALAFRPSAGEQRGALAEVEGRVLAPWRRSVHT